MAMMTIEDPTYFNDYLHREPSTQQRYLAVTIERSRAMAERSECQHNNVERPVMLVAFFQFCTNCHSVLGGTS